MNVRSVQEVICALKSISPFAILKINTDPSIAMIKKEQLYSVIKDTTTSRTNLIQKMTVLFAQLVTTALMKNYHPISLKE